MRYDKEETVWFVTPKEMRSIKRVRAMLNSVCAMHDCRDCPFASIGRCLKSQFAFRFERRAKVEKKE